MTRGVRVWEPEPRASWMDLTDEQRRAVRDGVEDLLGALEGLAGALEDVPKELMLRIWVLVGVLDRVRTRDSA